LLFVPGARLMAPAPSPLEPALEPPSALEPAPALEPASALEPAAVPEPVAVEVPVAGALRRVGLTEPLVAAVVEGLGAGGDLEALVVEALAGRAAPPTAPRHAGSLLVVVGPGAVARRLAGALADEMGSDPTAVAYASCRPDAYAVATGSLLVRSAEEAAERAPGWRRGRPAVVAVDVALTDPGRAWAAHLIAALRPTAVWAVVEATAKTEDIVDYADALGGVDAVALENCDATVSPAALLTTTLAVARLDGQPATALRWAATVVDRVRS